METLAEPEGSLASKPDEAPTIVDETLKKISGIPGVQDRLVFASEVSVAGHEVNGVRVSVNKSDGVDGDVLVVQNQRLETKATVKKSFENRIEGVEQNILVVEAASSLDKNKKMDEECGEAIREDGTQMGSDSLKLRENGRDLGLSHGNEEKTVGNVEIENISPGMSECTGDDPARKTEVSGNGISLVVDFQGFSASKIKDNGDRAVEFSGFTTNKGNPTSECKDTVRSKEDKKNLIKEFGISLPENGKKPGTRVTVMPGPEVTKNVNIEEMKHGEEEEMAAAQENVDAPVLKFSVGDFVWGKIKSHPWWPGQIYDPSNASESTSKKPRKDRLLVAYFGDDSFAWCDPSQLKPFVENFEQLASQSNSKSFLYGVEEAVNEIGRCVELEMTCSCVRMETKTRITRSSLMNAKITGIAPVHEGGIGELLIAQFEAEKFLARLKSIAQGVPMTSRLELSVLIHRVSAFRQPKLRNKSGFDVHIRGQGDRPGISEDNLYQRKKQRSMAELLAEELDVEPENYGSEVAKEGMNSDASTSRKKKRNTDSKVKPNNDVAERGFGSTRSASSSKKRGRAGLLESPAKGENRRSGFQNVDGKTTERAKTDSVSRERKKSKYLSPPYTNLSRGWKGLASSKDSEIETPKVAQKSGAQSAISTANQLTGSHSPVDIGDKTLHSGTSKKPGRPKKYDAVSPQTPKESLEKIVFEEDNVSVDKIFLEFRYTALDPLYLRRNKSSDMVMGFFSSFRSSIYHNGINYGKYIKQLAVQDDRKGDPLETQPASLGESPQPTTRPHSRGKSEHRKRKRKEESASQTSKRKVENPIGMSDLKVDSKKGKNAVGTSAMKIDLNKEETEGEDSAAALLLTFSPGFSLPSKNDLIKLFGKFGPLNKLETKVSKDYACARVVYTSSSDAEKAFNNSEKVKPFGHAVDSYRLEYLSAAPRALEIDLNSNQDPPPPFLTEEGEPHINVPALRPHTGEAPPLFFMRQNLERMTSMLEKSGDKLSPQAKANLEDEIKDLLKKVSSMVQ